MAILQRIIVLACMHNIIMIVLHNDNIVIRITILLLSLRLNYHHLHYPGHDACYTIILSHYTMTSTTEVYIAHIQGLHYSVCVCVCARQTQ